MALINDFMSLIYPRHCQACGLLLFQHEKLICNLCRVNLPKSNFHLNPDNPLSIALGGRVPIEKSLCLYLFEKRGRVQELVHAIKYRQRKEIAEFLGDLLGKEYLNSPTPTPFDVLLPVPLHPNKLKSRGFNQSEVFAKGLSKSLSIPVEREAIIRKVDSSTQTRKKKYQRWENVEGMFALNNSHVLENKHILLVDDVVTTGATMEAMWQCLKEVEGIRVSVACIAFAKTDLL